MDKLGYKVIPTAKMYQFAKPGPAGDREGSLKIDFLTGPTSEFKDTKVRTDERRARPRPTVGIHAHPTNEAITLEVGLIPIVIEGNPTEGENFSATVFVPQPLTFAMMKLFAFRDRFEDPDKELGRYHALDIYAILATATEAEWKQALELSEINLNHEKYLEATKIVDEYFSSDTSLGILRMKESPYFRKELQLRDFIRDMGELFATAE